MKYLLILPTLELGGAERQAINFACYLKERGNGAVILGLSKPGRVNRICEEYEIQCDSLVYKRNVYSVVGKLLNFFHIVKWTDDQRTVMYMSRQLKKYVRDGNFDVCIAYCSEPNKLLGNMKLLYSKPICIWYQRDAGIYDDPYGMQRVAIKYMDFILANSQSGKNWLKKAFGKDAKLIGNGVKLLPPVKTRQEWRTDLGVGKNDIICTMVANLSSAKKHIFLLQAWRKMVDKNKALYCKLVFAGRFDDAYEGLKEYVEENQLQDTVTFLGQVSDVSGLLAATDICVFAAKSEGSPNGIIECSLQELPVVATDLPEIRDVVAEENWPYLFADGDVDELISKLLSLANCSELRGRLGRLNREKAITAFDPEKNFAELVKLVGEYRGELQKI